MGVEEEEEEEVVCWIRKAWWEKTSRPAFFVGCAVRAFLIEAGTKDASKEVEVEVGVEEAVAEVWGERAGDGKMEGGK